MIPRMILFLSWISVGVSFLSFPTLQQKNHPHTFTRISTKQRMTRPMNENFTETVLTSMNTISQEVEENESSSPSSISLYSPAWTNSIPSLESSGYVQTIHSIDDFIQFIDGPSVSKQQQQQQQQQQQDTLLIVKFHAHYCKICSRTILKYKKMAVKYSLETKSNTSTSTTASNNIAFANVEITENPKLCQILGISRFPFIQIYRNGEKIASFGTGPAHNFQKIVGDTIDELLYRTTKEDWEVKRRKYALELQQSKDQLKELRSLAMMEDECRKAGVNWLGYNISP